LGQLETTGAWHSPLSFLRAFGPLYESVLSHSMVLLPPYDSVSSGSIREFGFELFHAISGGSGLPRMLGTYRKCWCDVVTKEVILKTKKLVYDLVVSYDILRLGVISTMEISFIFKDVSIDIDICSMRHAGIGIP